jgi:hypothetical protein
VMLLMTRRPSITTEGSAEKSLSSSTSCENLPRGVAARVERDAAVGFL